MSKLDKKTISIISNTASEDLAKRVLSIPVYPEMTQDEQVRVVDVIREFFVPN